MGTCAEGVCACKDAMPEALTDVEAGGGSGRSQCIVTSRAGVVARRRIFACPCDDASKRLRSLIQQVEVVIDESRR